MAESAQDTRPVLRMAGICKKCHRLKFGFLVKGHGLFICYNCGTGAEAPPPTPSDTRNYSFTYYTTTSSNTTSNWSQYGRETKESGTADQ